MKRFIASIALLFIATAAWGQAYNPQIAYTKFEGGSDNIYLANADGTKPVIVYKAYKVRLDGIDIDPTSTAASGRIAFLQSGALKVLSYTVSPTGITATSPTTLATGAPYQGERLDFSPDGSKIIYTKFTSPPPALTDIRLILADGSDTAKRLHSSRSISGVRWIGPKDFVFITDLGFSFPTEIQLASLDAGDNLVSSPATMFTSTDAALLKEVGGSVDVGIEDVDVARTRAALIFTTGGPGPGNYRHFVEYNMLTGDFTKHFSNNGWRAHFSNDDAYIFYLHGSTRTYNVYDAVYRFDTNSRSTIKLASKGQFGYADSKP